MSLLRISDDSPVYPPYVDAEGNQYPTSIDELFTDDELAALGWRRRPPPPPTKEQLKNYAYELRRRKARRTIDIAIPRVDDAPIVVPFALSADNIEDLAKAERRARREPEFQFLWARAAGSLTLDATQVLAIADAVDDYTQAIFVALAEIYAGIDAVAITTLAEIDAWVWPGD